MARPKANVLPDPVGAFASTSRAAGDVLLLGHLVELRPGPVFQRMSGRAASAARLGGLPSEVLPDRARELGDRLLASRCALRALDVAPCRRNLLGGSHGSTSC